MGSKARFASSILDAMERRFGKATTWTTFYDVCCGTASVGIEALKRNPRLKVICVDAGNFGRFWEIFQADKAGVIKAVQRLYADASSMAAACRIVNETPQSKSAATWAAQFLAATGGSLYTRPANDFDGKKGKIWHTTCSLGGDTHAPNAARTAAARLVEKLQAVPRFKAVWGQAENIRWPRGGKVVAVMDPPYVATNAGYAKGIDIPKVVQAALDAGVQVALCHDSPYPGVKGPSIKLRSVVGNKPGVCLRNLCREEWLIFPTGTDAAKKR
jgi:predicted RNA methylase